MMACDGDSENFQMVVSHTRASWVFWHVHSKGWSGEDSGFVCFGVG